MFGYSIVTCKFAAKLTGKGTQMTPWRVAPAHCRDCDSEVALSPLTFPNVFVRLQGPNLYETTSVIPVSYKLVLRSVLSGWDVLYRFVSSLFLHPGLHECSDRRSHPNAALSDYGKRLCMSLGAPNYTSNRGYRNLFTYHERDCSASACCTPTPD